MRARVIRAVVALLLGFATVSGAATVDRLLSQRVSLNPLGLTPVVITYAQRPGPADLDALRALRIRGGVVLSELPMVLTAVNLTQLNALRQNPRITSLYANRRLPLLSNKSRPFIGLTALLADAEVTSKNGGLPVSGRNIGVAYVDTGIDGSHGDVFFGQSVVQNVLFPIAEVSAVEWPLPDGFTPVVAIENQPVTDIEGGHGTFGAAVTAGSGAHSGNFYGGVAPGAKLIGLVAGNDVGLTVFAILQAYNYTLANQFRYNIRVCNNSFGTVLAEHGYDPEDPINRATRVMHDRNIVVVFAAGNGIDNVGTAPGAINPYSVAPWVISVGAGEKQGLGQPASFSSRGEDNGTGVDVAGQPADPSALPNLRPDLIGSGVDIKSARSKFPGVTNLAGTLPVFVGANDLTTIAPAFLPFYTTSQGTSFAAPQVTGVVALMLEANPTLTPDDVVSILRATATPMPYDQRTVGAGYVDARNAVRAAMSLGAVPHPAVLVPTADMPEILDSEGDQLGTAGQDIRAVDFSYDASSDQIVYALSVTDLKDAVNNPKPNQRWTMSSDFGATTVFVTASIDETGTAAFEYGRITTLATGTRNQESIGVADAGSIDDSQNRITIRLARGKVSAAVGSDVLSATSTNTAAQAQVLVGASLTGGLLLSSDDARGGSWTVGEQAEEPPPPPPPACVDSTERLAGALAPGTATEIAFAVTCTTVRAQMTFNPGNQPVGMDLLNDAGVVIASAERHDRLTATALPPGRYVYRVRGPVTAAVDFVIKSTQSK